MNNVPRKLKSPLQQLCYLHYCPLQAGLGSGYNFWLSIFLSFYGRPQAQVKFLSMILQMVIIGIQMVRLTVKECALYPPPRDDARDTDLTQYQVQSPLLLRVQALLILDAVSWQESCKAEPSASFRPCMTLSRVSAALHHATLPCCRIQCSCSPDSI